MTYPEIRHSVRCARCSAEHTVHCMETPAGLQPNPDTYLLAHGWTRTAVLPGGQAIVDLPGGRKGVVQLQARTVENPTWTCSQAHARELATRIERDDERHSVDGGSQRGRDCLAAGSHSTPGDGRHAPPERTHTCTCGTTIAVPTGFDSARREVFMLAHGWDSPEFCSIRCRILAGLRAAEPPPKPVLAIDDAHYQATRARLSAQAPASKRSAKEAR